MNSGMVAPIILPQQHGFELVKEQLEQGDTYL